MVSNIDSSSGSFLTSLARTQAQLTKAETQLSSGLRITTASDDPDQIAPLLQLRAALARNTQLQSNLTLAATDASAADSTISSAITLMDRALVLGQEGLNTTATTETRTTLAAEVQSTIDQIVSYTQTAVNGRYIFSGDNATIAMYETDSTGTTDYTYARQFTTTAARLQEDPAGGTFAVSKTAQDIFDVRDSSDLPTTGNVLSALTSLHAALLSDSTTDISTAVTSIKSASTYLNQQLSFYGNVETQISDAQTFATSQAVSLQTQIGTIQDADVTAATLAMTQANTAITAALEARSKMSHNNLFDMMG
jgi:flagellar hook-associated protein 3 FlgL